MKIAHSSFHGSKRQLMITLNTIHHIYFIAIGGTAMASLAGMLKASGYQVSGSDQNMYPPMSTFLEEQGIKVYQGFDPAHLSPEPDLVIIGNAMSRGNPEVEIVLERKIRYTSLPEALKEFFIRGKYSLVITGTHGKTTTSSLLSWVLEQAGADPSFLIGGIPENFGRGYKLGQGRHFVVEGDEYDTAFFDKGPKFLHYLPEVVIINNIEFDHADIYNTLEEIKISFKRLINIIPRNGLLLGCSDDPVVVELLPAAVSPVQTFGLNKDALWQAQDLQFTPEETRFKVLKDRKVFSDFSIPLSGSHNVKNALGVIAVANHLGISLPDIKQAFLSFKGVKKRLQLRAEIDDILIYDDFAHHPTEIRETLNGLRQRFPKRKIWALFEPRTATSKRKVLLNQLAQSFQAADRAIIGPLHRPEKVRPEERLSVDELIPLIRKNLKEAYYFDSVDHIVEYLAKHLHKGDIVVTMSNGDFGGIHQKLIQVLK